MRTSWILYVKKDNRFERVVSLGSLAQIKRYLKNVANPLVKQEFSSRIAAMYSHIELKIEKVVQYCCFSMRQEWFCVWYRNYDGWKIYGEVLADSEKV